MRIEVLWGGCFFLLFVFFFKAQQEGEGRVSYRKYDREIGMVVMEDLLRVCKNFGFYLKCDNIQTAHTTQYQKTKNKKTKQPNPKMGRRPK